MRHRTPLASVISLLALLDATANAATYYVSTSGRNANPGTLGQPFRTISYGVSRLAAGDTLYVRGGTYHESVVIWGKAGTSSAPIRIARYLTEAPVIDGSGTKGEGVVVIGGDARRSAYVSFDGFEVKNGPNHGIFLYNANHIKIRWNRVHHHRACGILVASASSSPIGTTHHVLVQGNYVHHNVLENGNAGTHKSGAGDILGNPRLIRASGWESLETWRAQPLCASGEDRLGRPVEERHELGPGQVPESRQHGRTIVHRSVRDDEVAK